MEIFIDGIMPCLKRISDGTIVQTSYSSIIPKKGEFKDWLFAWYLEPKKGYSVYALRVEGSDDVQGLVSMAPEPESMHVWLNLAEASPCNNKINPCFCGTLEYSGIGAHLTALGVKMSLELGYNGIVSFDAKTNLIEHYREVLGAVQVGRTSRMYIPEDAARRLYGTYFG
jgi:hypothetical protein